MPEKTFINPRELLLDSYRLARQILDSGFRPNFIVGIWRGGCIPGIAVQDFFSYHGIQTDHISLRTSEYKGIGEVKETIEVHGTDYLVRNANADDKLLLVDDVYERGLSLQAVMEKLARKMRLNLPKDIRIATVYYKPECNLTQRVPDYFVHQTNSWIVFPHELEGLTEEEIRKGKGEDILRIIKDS